MLIFSASLRSYASLIKMGYSPLRKNFKVTNLNNVGCEPPGKDRWVGKVNFVEIRSYWHVFRSFDRMWSFFILCLQAMIIVAWNGSGDLSSIFDYDVFKKVLSVFITASILKLGQAVLDVVLNWKALQCMPFYVKLRYLLKVVAAAAWVVILPVTYAYTSKNPAGLAQTIKGFWAPGETRILAGRPEWCCSHVGV